MMISGRVLTLPIAGFFAALSLSGLSNAQPVGSAGSPTTVQKGDNSDKTNNAGAATVPGDSTLSYDPKVVLEYCRQHPGAQECATSKIDDGHWQDNNKFCTMNPAVCNSTYHDLSGDVRICLKHPTWPNCQQL
ncbi:MAG: hypothetical protein WB709_02540 [Solirubrobacteraceae bacterium]